MSADHHKDEPHHDVAPFPGPVRSASMRALFSAADFKASTTRDGGTASAMPVAALLARRDARDPAIDPPDVSEWRTQSVLRMVVLALAVAFLGMLVTYDSLWQQLATGGLSKIWARFDGPSQRAAPRVTGDVWVPTGNDTLAVGATAYISATTGRASAAPPPGRELVFTPCATAVPTSRVTWCRTSTHAIVPLQHNDSPDARFGNVSASFLTLLGATSLGTDFEALCTMDGLGKATVWLCSAGGACRSVANASSSAYEAWSSCRLAPSGGDGVVALLHAADGAARLIHASVGAWHLDGAGGHSGLALSLAADASNRIKSAAVACESSRRCIVVARRFDGTVVASLVDTAPFVSHSANGFVRVAGAVTGNIVNVVLESSPTIVTSDGAHQCTDLGHAGGQCSPIFAAGPQAAVIGAVAYADTLVFALRRTRDSASSSIELLRFSPSTGTTTQLTDDALPAAEADHGTTFFLTTIAQGALMSDGKAMIVNVAAESQWVRVGSVVQSRPGSALIRISVPSH